MHRAARENNPLPSPAPRITRGVAPIHIPVTPEDFRLIGQRFASEDIVKQVDRLSPVAEKDTVGLATQEYYASDLQELKACRAQLTGESAERRLAREAKKGSHKTEIDAVVKGKRLLRCSSSATTASPIGLPLHASRCPGTRSLVGYRPSPE